MGTDAFISKWQGISASELSTSQSFLIDLCALLGVDVPHATAAQDYMDVGGFVSLVSSGTTDFSTAGGPASPFR